MSRMSSMSRMTLWAFKCSDPSRALEIATGKAMLAIALSEGHTGSKWPPARSKPPTDAPKAIGAPRPASE